MAIPATHPPRGDCFQTALLPSPGLRCSESGVRISPLSAALEVVGTSCCFSSKRPRARGRKQTGIIPGVTPELWQVVLSSVHHSIPEDCPQPSRETTQSLSHWRKTLWDVSTLTHSHSEASLRRPFPCVQCSFMSLGTLKPHQVYASSLTE